MARLKTTGSAPEAIMVYVPLSRERARELRRTGVLDGPLQAHAATPGLLRAHDLGADAEDAEYTALAYAGISALLLGDDQLRLVVAAQIDPGSPMTAGDDAFGRVRIDRLAWSTVSALFADSPESTNRISRARTLAPVSFEAALDDEEVEALLDASDLLWFAPEELDRLPAAAA
jgi:Family of unknown function (DUF6912)